MAAAPLPRKVDLSDLAGASFMNFIWKKRVRGQLRTMRFQDFVLAHDPLEYLAFDWDLDNSIAALCREVRAGTYRAGAPEVVRSAKSMGLTRPLAFLSIRDLLLYKTIVAKAENSLIQKSRPWTRFGRADTGDENTGDTLAVSGWFRDWLRRQGQIWVITENQPWLIETDIANFFPYIYISSVLSHVLSHSNLGEDAVRLLDHMLRQFSPMTQYRRSPLVGLPQESFDCSRILAHTYLNPLDDAFEAEGNLKQYSRWMDDIVIGANSKEEALQKVQRVQDALEQLGLYPNTAKTRIIKAEEFSNDYMKDENDYLGEVDERFKSKQPEDIAVFRSRLRHHLRIREPRPKA